MLLGSGPAGICLLHGRSVELNSSFCGGMICILG